MKKKVPVETAIGKRYGRLVALRVDGRDKWRKKILVCRCDCGNEIRTDKSRLDSGNTASCGCLHNELLSKRNTTHGKTATKEYLAWQHIKARCYNSKTKDYIWYGARGITVCARWLNSFENFLTDMGERPSPLHSIERRDNSKGYSPSNCRWATPKEQANNKRNNHVVEFNGERMTLMQWGEKLGVPNERIRARLKLGYTPEQAITLKRYEYR